MTEGLNEDRRDRTTAASRTYAAEAAAMLAHEIRGPLTVVLGYLGLLGRVTDAGTRGHALEGAVRAAGRIEAIIDDVLASLGPEGAEPVVCTTVDASALAARMVADLPRSPVRVTASGGEPCVAHANEIRLARALGNLLDNAIKFSPPHGTVLVSVARRGERVLLAVSDEGPGIPADSIDHVFEPFGRLARDNGTPGTGLGLALARDAVRSFGGDVRVEPLAGDAGARVVIDVPAANGG